MKKILDITAALDISKKLHEKHMSIVLAGGCFDILHAGHIAFLREAKKQGDILMVLLEDDEQIKKLKGASRPINCQKNRATILAALHYVDYVVLLTVMPENQAYDDLILQIKPAIIATTKGDPYRHHKERQVQQIGAIVVDVIDRVKDQSSTRLAERI